MAVVGSQRVAPKKRCKARAYAGRAAALGLLWSTPALAQSEHVENRCPRLSAADYEELDARVLLLLKGKVDERPAGLPAVGCSWKGSWGEWECLRFYIV